MNGRSLITARSRAREERGVLPGQLRAKGKTSAVVVVAGLLRGLRLCLISLRVIRINATAFTGKYRAGVITTPRQRRGERRGTRPRERIDNRECALPPVVHGYGKNFANPDNWLISGKCTCGSARQLAPTHTHTHTPGGRSRVGPAPVSS